MYCCHAFENLIKNAGKRGHAVLVGRLKGEIFFSLQMRALDFPDMGQASQLSKDTDIEYLTLTASMRIRYCPSCGTCLADIARANARSIKKLIPQHEPFQDNWGV